MDDPVTETDRAASVRPRQFALVALCFLFSGFAALLYETVWLRQFAILLGTTEQALAIVLASYMGGLAIGAWIAGRIVDRIRRPLLTYGVLELGIAVTALMIPLGLAIVRNVQALLFGGLSEPPAAGGFAQGLFVFSSAFGLIAIPTGLMGATLPLLARYAVREDRELGPKIGMLYSINTFGAVLGTMTAAFVCLPAVGLARTTWIGAAVNVFVFLLVVVLVRDSSATDDLAVQLVESTESNEHNANDRKRRERQARKSPGAESLVGNETRYRWILLLVAISGAISFCYEIIFTRMLGHFLGGSLYSFATMLAGFLLGIALGGAIASRFARTRREAVVGFVYAEAFVAIAALLAFRSVDQMVIWPWQDWAGGSNTKFQVTASILALLPTATCIGATFPFAIRVFARDEKNAASASACVYSWNVVGGIAGALLTGMLLMPLLQYHGATWLAAFINLALAVAAVLVLQAKRQHLIAPAIGMVCLLVFLPGAPENVIRVSALNGVKTSGRIAYNHVGKSATVSVFYDEGDIRFQTNGLPEASLMPRDCGMISKSVPNWLTALPPLLNPDCESMLVVGLGGGAALEEVAPSVRSIDVVELEPSVIEANRSVATLRTRDPLADSRIRIILNDGRNALARTSKTYDSIVSQPSHPWTAGASHLYTREFAVQVRAHLKPGGIFLQWMASEFIDAGLADSMGATLLDVFPHARLYQPFKGTFLFVASNQPIEPERIEPAPGIDPTLCVIPQINRPYYRRIGVVSRTHLVSMLSLDQTALEKMCDGAELIEDEQNLLAMRAPYLVYNPQKEEVESHVTSFSPITRGLSAMKILCPTFDVVAFARRQKMNGHAKYLTNVLPEQIEDPADRAFIEYLIAAGALQGNMSDLANLRERFPNDPRFAFMFLRLSLVGMAKELTEQEVDELKAIIPKHHVAIIETMEATYSNDWKTARNNDTAMAAISVDDFAHEAAVMFRIPWRMEGPPEERVARGEEMMRIIDGNAAFIHPGSMSWFRVIAAIRAGRPLAALGTASYSAHEIEKLLAKNDPSVNVGNLVRIRRSIANPAVFASVPDWRYREVVTAVDDVLRQTTPQTR